MKNPRFYDIEKSPLYKVGPKKLAALLGEESWCSINELVQLPIDKIYRCYETNGRWIEQPCPRLDKLQKRLAKLLARISPPDYLHSGVKGRSYKTNAERHLINSSSRMITMDIKSFYPSTRRSKVRSFFHKTLKCDIDIAELLSKLSTINGHIPTGSSVSTILSYYAYKPMFDEIDKLTTYNNCVFSCYVDDLTISGACADRSFAKKIRSIIRGYNLTPHPKKTFYYNAASNKTVTGVIITQSGIRLPNIRRKQIHEDYLLIAQHLSEGNRQKAFNRLLGRLSEAGTLEPKYRAYQSRLAKRRDEILE